MVEIKKIVQLLHEYDILFSYSGLISQDILVQLANVAKKDLITKEEQKQKVNKIYEVIIEMFHNTLSYSKDRVEIAPNKFEAKGSCLISRNTKEESYSVFSINTIDPKGKKDLSKKIDLINNLTQEERKNFLKQQLKIAREMHERGAGLGFFEMSKRASKKLHYEFFTIKEKEYFVVQVTI